MTNDPPPRRAIRAGALAAGMLMLIALPARADDYSPYGIDNSPFPIPTLPGVSLQFVGSETGSFESNPLMLITGAKDLYGSVTSPELIFNDKTPTSQLNADVLVNENLFNQSSFDSTDLHGKFGLNEQVERWSAGAQIVTDYDTTRTSELFPIGLNGSLVNTAVRHLGLSLAPQVSYSPTANDKVSLLGTVSDSQYESSVFGNYGTASLTPTYMHNFDPLNAGVISVQAQRYAATSGPPVTVDSVGPSIGWIGTLTPRLTAKATVGVQSSRQFGSGAVQEPWSLQYIFSGDLMFKGQQDKADLQTSRADYPFGNGTESLLTTVGLTEQHNINASFSVNVGASYQKADYQSSANGNLDYLVSGTGGVTYHATQRLDIAATYQYRRETINNTPGNAQDNMVQLGLVFRPQAWNF